MPHHGEAIGWPQATTLPTYTVWRDGAVYYAMNNTTGAIEFQGADPAVVVQACLTAGGAGCVVGMREAIYVALTGVAATANNQRIYGLGEGTYWDATALLTTVHAFSLTGFDNCELRNFAIETSAGVGKTCHCVFIEDGADNFHLIDLTIIDSDSDGIHVEGTTITQGHIHRCHVDGADGAGIIIDMDAANFMYRLHVEDCDVVNCGTQGIEFAASGGNLYCEVINNVVFGCSGTGINVVDGDYSMVRGNICISNGSRGIEINASIYAQVSGNIVQGSTGYGIYIFSGSNRCTVTGNVSQGNGTMGIYVSSSNNCTVTGNVSQGNNNHGFACFAAAHENTFTGNHSLENVQHGIALSGSNDCTIVGNTCIGNDSGNTGNYDGINLDTCNRVLVVGNQCQDQQGWGIQVDDDSNYCKIASNYTALNVAGSINVNGATCDVNQLEFNTVEEGAPVDTGTGTREYGDYDPSTDTFFIIGAPPF